MVRMLAGRYRVEEAVGRGGSAVVHRGWDRTLKRRVAVKVFSSYRADGDEPSAEVLREARTAAGLNHPNVARVYDYGEATEGSHRVPYLVMEFIDGDTLADRIARDGALPWPEAAVICAATAAALATAHERDLVHRDIKPRNVMLPSGGGVKVVDFGIAAAAGQNSVDTQGNLWGTPVSLAPEQLRGEPTYPAADVYALGLLLFECLVGRAAWQGGSVGEILAQRHNNPAPRLPRISGLPREIVKLYEACTADRPEQRPTAAEARAVLRRAAGLVPTLRPQIALLPAVPRATGTPATSVEAATVPSAVTPSRPAGLLPKSVVSRTRPGGSRPQQRSRRRAAAVASMAVATAVVSVLGLQLANGTGNPGGRTAEAAVDGAAIAPTPQPIDTPPVSSASPRATTPTATDATTTAPVYAVPVDRTTRGDYSDDDDNEGTKPPKSTRPTAKPTDDPTDPAESTPPSSGPSTPTDEPTDDPTDEPTDPQEPEDPESTPTPDEPTDDPTTDPESTPTGDNSPPVTGDGGGTSSVSSNGSGSGSGTPS